MDKIAQIKLLAKKIYQKLPEIKDNRCVFCLEINFTPDGTKLFCETLDLKMLAQSIIEADNTQKFESRTLLTVNEAVEYSYIKTLKKVHDQISTGKCDRMMLLNIMNEGDLGSIFIFNVISLENLTYALEGFFLNKD